MCVMGREVTSGARYSNGCFGRGGVGAVLH